MSESIGTSSQRPVRQWPFIQRTRPTFELGDDDRPPVPYKPALYLPTVFMDMELRDWVTIPKGVIVAASPTNAVTPLTLGVLVPANGGADATDTYTINDQNAGVRDTNGNLVIAGQTYTRVANEPIGLAYVDMFQDIRGRYLNYQIQPDALGILCRRTIELPYFTHTDLGTSTFSVAQSAVQAKVGGLAYGGTATAASTTYSTHDDLQNGNWLMSDANGKFVKWDGVDVKQVVGQTLLVDTNYPKDLLQFVQTYPLSEMPGSETGGFPGLLAAVGATKAVRIRLKF